MRSLILFASAAILAGCATAVGTAYAPADSKGYGFSETRIEDERWRVEFAGDGGTPADVVEDYALLRAAELTVANGFDWFRIVSRGMDAQARGGVGIGAGVGSGSYGRRGGVSVGVGGNLGTVGGKEFYTARLEILMGAGETPDDADVYDARDVIDNIMPMTRGEAY